MTTTPNFQDLAQQIEQVVQAHIAASRRAATAALERAFAATAGSPSKTRAPRSGKNARRRTPAEIAALGEQLYQAACAKPGETMTVLAADVGEPVRGLQRPMAHLKQAGQIRSVGQRHLTRYFPLVSTATGSA